MSIYRSPLCSCIVCGTQKSVKGIHSHFYHKHGTDEEKQKMKSGSAKGAAKGTLKAAMLAQETKVCKENEYYKKPSHCTNCKCRLSYEQRNNKFCSHSCSATFSNKARGPRSQKTIEKIRAARKNQTNIGVRQKHGPHTKLYGYKSCTCCNQKFWATTPGKKTCSPECSRKNSSYRKIVFEYMHNGELLYLESSWEVEIAEWLTNLNFRWERPKHIPWVDSKGKQRRYFPDFYLLDYDLYLDPKNSYQIKISTEKLNVICNQVTLIYGTVEYIKHEVLLRLSI